MPQHAFVDDTRSRDVHVMVSVCDSLIRDGHMTIGLPCKGINGTIATSRTPIHTARVTGICTYIGTCILSFSVESRWFLSEQVVWE